MNNNKHAVTAINPKYQSKVNKCLKYDAKYDEANDARDRADGDGNIKLYNQLERKCEKLYDAFLTYYEELPKREQKNLDLFINR